jgi:putative ABC transport system permease protein
MRILAILKLALRALKRNPMRTLLTMLGIIIGVGAVIAMVGIGNGAKSQVEAQIAQLGQNVVLIMSGNVSRGGFSMGFGSSPSLTKGDYSALRKEIPGIVGVSPEVRSFAQVAAGSQNSNVQVMGVGEDYVSIRAWPVANGENFTETDVKGSRKVVLLGKTTATTLFADADPVGQTVRVKGAPYVVVGVLTAKGMSMMGSDQDDVVLMPYTSAMVRLSNATAFRSFNVQASGPSVINSVTNGIVDLLRQRHRITAGKDDDFIVRTQQEISEMATATSRVMTILLAAIASVSLVVGGIGIMNIMLVSVTERTREIGVRLAVGARGGDILQQFLIEAVVLSVTGGLIGILLGVGSAQIISSKMKWPIQISPESVLVAFVFSAAIGVFFGFYPARKASRLDPIDALRYE